METASFPEAIGFKCQRVRKLAGDPVRHNGCSMASMNKRSYPSVSHSHYYVQSMVCWPAGRACTVLSIHLEWKHKPLISIGMTSCGSHDLVIRFTQGVIFMEKQYVPTARLVLAFWVRPTSLRY